MRWDETTLKGLLRWCGPRQSIALLGSSGVGKSTLVNTLSGQEVQTTRAVRSEDDKGSTHDNPVAPSTCCPMAGLF